MTKVDQFESAFRAAAKTAFDYSPVEIESVLVVTDREGPAASEFGDKARSFLSVLDRGENVRWRTVDGTESDAVPALLDLVEVERPGLICTYRHLHSDSWRWPYTLGEYIDVLTQVTTTPVLVLPHPRADFASDHAMQGTEVVMAVTNHLQKDHRLVNYAASLVKRGGTTIYIAVKLQ